MPKKLSVTISFKPEFAHLYEFLKTKDNKSAYIVRLIEQDVKQTGSKQNLREEIVEILKDLLKDNHFDLVPLTKKDTEENPLTENDIDIINNFF